MLPFQPSLGRSRDGDHDDLDSAAELEGFGIEISVLVSLSQVAFCL